MTTSSTPARTAVTVAVREVLFPAGVLAAERDRRGMKVFDLAMALKVHPSYIARWESGASAIRSDYAAALADLYDLDVSFHFDGK
jgi:transcriptional regulator with XRE-family HTH domain